MNNFWTRWFRDHETDKANLERYVTQTENEGPENGNGIHMESGNGDSDYREDGSGNHEDQGNAGDQCNKDDARRDQ